MCQSSSPLPEATTPVLTGPTYPFPTGQTTSIPTHTTTTVGDFVLTHLTFSDGTTYSVIICSACRVTVSLANLKGHLEAESRPHHNLDLATRQDILRQGMVWCTTDVPEFKKAPTTQLLGIVPHIPIDKEFACEYCEEESQRYLARTVRSMRDHINRVHPGCASHRTAPNVDMQHIGANLRNAKWFRVDPPVRGDAAGGRHTS